MNQTKASNSGPTTIFLHGYLSHPDVIPSLIGDRLQAVAVHPAVIRGYRSLYDLLSERLILCASRGSVLTGIALRSDDNELFKRISAVFRGTSTAITGELEGEEKSDLYCFNIVSENEPFMEGESPTPELAKRIIASFLSSEFISGEYPRERRWKGAILSGLQSLAGQTDENAHDSLGLNFSQIRSEPVFRGYLHVDDLLLERNNRSAGGGSLRRSVASWGDMVFVLPYDPNTRRILLIEQFRPGRFLRERGNGMCIGPIGGRCDREERASQTARREAQEEAGIVIARLHELPGYYSSPGLSSEYVTGFIGEANLQSAGGQFGNKWEAEDIRAFTLSLDDALRLIKQEQIPISHGLISLLYLALNEDWIRSKWLTK